MSTCPHCGQPDGDCYNICPSQDPYGGDQAAEAADHDFNARYDDVRERFAATAADADLFFMGDDDHEVNEVSVTDHPDGSRTHEYTGLVHPDEPAVVKSDFFMLYEREPEIKSDDIPF
jgi:hypothetical protein